MTIQTSGKIFTVAPCILESLIGYLSPTNQSSRITMELICSSILILLLESCLQTCTTYAIAVFTVNNCWWWTEELSETFRASFPKWIWEISASSWFYCKEIWKNGDRGLNERNVSEFVKTGCEENRDKHAMLAGNQILDHGLQVYHYISLPGTSWSTGGTISTDLCLCLNWAILLETKSCIIFTQHHSVLVSTPAIYYGGPWFKIGLTGYLSFWNTLYTPKVLAVIWDP
jgi:hypothetical protein